VLDDLASAAVSPVVNAMTDVNHPCEVLFDLHALRERRDIRGLRFLFVGGGGNIVRGWQEAARTLSFDLMQCCPAELATPGSRWTDDLETAVRSADVILTDGWGSHSDQLTPYQITASLLDAAPAGVQLNPWTPFQRGQEVNADAINHPAFVGYQFKSSLLHVQQAIMATYIIEP
jgi:ornithine carbamoyltransferase